MLKPFKWPHPLIFNLPENFIHILDSPFPILIGINNDLTFVYDNNLHNEHPNCIFIYLDDGRPTRPLIRLVNHEIPMDELKQLLENPTTEWRHYVQGPNDIKKDISEQGFTDPLAAEHMPSLERYNTYLTTTYTNNHNKPPPSSTNKQTTNKHTTTNTKHTARNKQTTQLQQPHNQTKPI